MIFLLLTAYNRPEYISRCLDSIYKAETKGVTIVLVDDASDNPTAIELINNAKVDKVLRHNVNAGIRYALKTGYEYCFNNGAEIVINLDTDAIVKPDFIQRLTQLKKQFPDHLVTGFNSRNKKQNGELRNPVISEHDGYCMRKYCNGINMVVNKQQYQQFIQPALQQNTNWDYNVSTSQTLPVICTVPSVVQHIGLKSSMGHGSEAPDIAQDFKQLELPTVTLLGTDCRDKTGIIKAGEVSCLDIQFGEVKIITDELFRGIENYSRWYIKECAKFIDTEHVLIIHADGYVLNQMAWQNDWLQYDYIGATWWYKDNMNVGNGGFSLRSKKLLDIIANDPHITDLHPEDDRICRMYRPYLEQKYDIKYAPEEVANKFSIEAYNSPDNEYNGQFGFHGKHVKFNKYPHLKHYLTDAIMSVPRKPIGKPTLYNKPQKIRRWQQ